MLKRKLRETLGIIAYIHICCQFLNNSHKKLEYQQDIHSKNIFYLGIENPQTSHDAYQVISNYSSHVLNESKKAYFVRV